MSPCSVRESVSRAVMSFVILSVCSSIDESASSISSSLALSDSAYSHSAFITASGVRSSCEASEVNCFSFSNEVWSLASMSLKVSASVYISPALFSISMRFERSVPSVISCAERQIFSTGFIVLRDIKYAPTAAIIINAGRMYMTVMVIASNALLAASALMNPRTQTGG